MARNLYGRMARRFETVGRQRRVRSSSAGIAAMSHELREPMNGVLGMSRVLAETPLTAAQQDIVATIVDSAEALLTVLNDILDLSRVEAGRLELRATAFDPRLLLQRTCASFVQKAGAKGLAFRHEVAAEVPARLQGDPGRIRQVLVNLIGNAIKFTDAGHVRLSARSVTSAAGHHLLLEVADTGPGFGKATLARLFSAYGQADASTPRLFGGSGLGLMIAQRLIHAMGGKLEVGSVAGEGTRFLVNLPCRPAPADDAALQPVSLAGLNLLVVVPLVETRRRLRQMLGSWGVGVRGAAGADDALREIQEARTRGELFDLAIIDAGMPDPEVRGVLTALRASAGAALRTICLASSGLRGDAARADALEFDGYLTAPVADHTLMQMLIRLAQHTQNKRFLTRHDVGEGHDGVLRILVADDNPVNCRLASLLLEKAGHSVVTVNDGAAAVAAVTDGSFDLVLMDVQMPGTDGLEATRRIRRLDCDLHQRIPIVALTAEAMPGDERRVLDAGMDGYLTKPIDRPKLLSTIQSWAGRGRGGLLRAEIV